MSSPEVESFEVTEDDLLNEFNPNRRRFRQSKNKAIYGRLFSRYKVFKDISKAKLHPLKVKVRQGLSQAALNV